MKCTQIYPLMFYYIFPLFLKKEEKVLPRFIYSITTVFGSLLLS